MKLREVEIETHTMCNARCRYCVYPSIRDRVGRNFMDKNLFLEILHGLDFARDDLKNIHLHHVNEPFMHPELPWFVEQARKAFPDQHVGFSTNAILLTPERAEAVLTAGLNLIYITVPSSDPDQYRRIMGVKADVNAVLANVRHFLETAGRDVRIVVRSPLGFDPGLEKFYAPFADIEMEAIPISSRLGAVDEGLSSNLHAPSPDAAPAPCSLAWIYNYLVVCHNGDVPVCCNDQEHRWIVGNVRDAGVEPLWNSEAFSRVRRWMAARDPRPEGLPCNHCEFGLREDS